MRSTGVMPEDGIVEFGLGGQVAHAVGVGAGVGGIGDGVDIGGARRVAGAVGVVADLPDQLAVRGVDDEYRLAGQVVVAPVVEGHAAGQHHHPAVDPALALQVTDLADEGLAPALAVVLGEGVLERELPQHDRRRVAGRDAGDVEAVVGDAAVLQAEGQEGFPGGGGAAVKDVLGGRPAVDGEDVLVVDERLLQAGQDLVGNEAPQLLAAPFSRVSRALTQCRMPSLEPT